MYVSGEGLQWYDPALLFPLCPLGGDAGGDDGDSEGDPHTSAGPPSVFQARGSFSGGGRDVNMAQVSPAALNRHVRHRARELLLDRLSGDTLTSDREACASVAALVKSLYKGEPVQLTAGTTTNDSSPKSQQSHSTSNTNHPTKPTPRGASSFAANLSGATLQGDGQRRQRRHHGAHSPMSMLGAGDARDELDELFASDAESAKDYFDDVEEDGAEDEDDDAFSLGGWPGLRSRGRRGEDSAAAAKHARELRAYFLSLPAQLGVQEEPVLCPVDLQADPLAHVVAAAEVFVVVTATVPQTLYVFDQLNGLPISSSVLGGMSYTANGSGAAAGSTSYDASAAARVVACTIDASDTVQQLWMDPSGHYCVLAFASGKCVYFYIPRRPSANPAPGFGGATITAHGATSKGPKECEKEGDDEGDDSPSDTHDDGPEIKRRRRQERQKEWREAARRWLRFSLRRHSSSKGDGADDVDGADTLHDRDAAYRPRGFSLTYVFPQSSSSGRAAATGADDAAPAWGPVPNALHTATSTLQATGSPHSSFAPSCVGWCRHITTSGGVAMTTTTSVSAASCPRSILKTRERLPDSHAASPQLALDTNAATPAPASSLPPSGAAVEALLGAYRGGKLLACLLTPTGAVDSRVVFTFPKPIALASIDSITAICAPALSLYGNYAEGHSDGAYREASRDSGRSNSAGRDAGGVSPSSSRHVRWGDDGSSQSNPGRGDGSGSRYSHGKTFVFPTYTHTPHFLHADEERHSEANAPMPSAPVAPPAASVASSTAAGNHQTQSLQRLHWVVLVSVRNRLYVFATPSTTVDFEELEEIRAVLRTADATDGASSVAGGPSPSLTRRVLEAATHRLTGRVEDAFLPYAVDRWSDVGPHGQGSEEHQASLTTAPAFSTLARPPLASHTVGNTSNMEPSATAAPSVDRLRNYITIEPSAFSKYTCAAYSSGASQVHTSLPGVTTAMTTKGAGGPEVSTSIYGVGVGEGKSANALGRGRDRAACAVNEACAASPAAPFLLESVTHGVLHLVLPPPRNSENSSVAAPADRWISSSATAPANGGGDGGDLVTPAALPPVFYWQYGDVVVQGVILCGAGGLEVGAKVRELVHRGMQVFASATAATTTDRASPHAYGWSAAHGGCARRGEAPSAAFSVNTPPTSGLEAGLTAVIDNALRDTQDLNCFAMQCRATAAESRGGGSRPGSHASPRPTSSSSAATAEGMAGQPGAGATTSRGRKLDASSATQPVVLPIGLLSVVNANSCLQSLRGLLDNASVTHGGGSELKQGTSGKTRELTYTRRTLRTTTSLAPNPVWAAHTTGPFPASTSRNLHGGFVGLGSKEEEAAAVLQASVSAALQNPLLQFPWTTRLQLRNAERGSAGSGMGVADGSRCRRHRHDRHECTDRQPPTPFTHFAAPATALEDSSDRGAALSAGPTRDRRSSVVSPRPSAGLGPSFDIPLLSDALARGDVSADAVRQLCAVAHAYVRRSPVLFGEPIERLLRASAAATRRPSASVAESHVRHPHGTAGPLAQCSSLASLVRGSNAAGDLLSRQRWLSPPYALQRCASTHSHAGVSAAATADGRGLPSGTLNCSSSSAQLMQRAYAAMVPVGASERGAREHSGNLSLSFTNAAVGERKARGPPSTACSPRLPHADPAALASPPSGADDVNLNPDGEVLVSMAASYSHITFTTTQGVYMLAHAAVLPVVEAALLWRRELVYHAVTTRASTTTAAGGHTPASPALPLPRALLFTTIADPAAADVFFLASRARMVRLQAPSLYSSAAGRRQFVMQLLAKAAATQQTNVHEPTPAHLRHPDALHRSRDAGLSNSSVEADDAGAATGRSVAAAIVEAMKGALPANETVVVPSSLSYEVRLKGWLGGAAERKTADAVRSANHGDWQGNRGDGDNIDGGDGLPHGGRGRQGSTHVPTSHGDGESVSWRSPHPSRSSSSRRDRFSASTTGTLTSGARSESQSVDSSLLSLDDVAPQGDLEPPAAMMTADVSEQRSRSNNEDRPPRASSKAAANQLRAPMSGAQHFLRHANMRALLLLTTPSNGFEVPLPPPLHGPEYAQRHQRSPAATAAAVPVVGAGVERPAHLLEVAAGDPAPAQHALPQLHMSNSGALRQSSFARPINGPVAPASPPIHRSSLRPAFPHPGEGQTAGTFTRFASLPALATDAAARAGASSLLPPYPSQASPASPGSVASGLADASEVKHAATHAHVAPAVTAAASGTASRAEDHDLVSFLAQNPLLHFLLQRCGTANGGEGGAHAEVGSTSAFRLRKRCASQTTHIVDRTRAVNIPGFGLLPGSAGLPPLTQVTSRAVASLLLQRPTGTSYYCADHLYELALAAAACSAHDASPASRRLAGTREDVSLLYLVRHAYGGFLLSQRRFLEAAVQFGKAPDGPTPFTAVFVELVRGFRESSSLAPLALFLQLRLRALEASALGLGGHAMEVSVLATWLLSLLLEQCSVARAKRQRHKACRDFSSHGRGSTGLRADVLKGCDGERGTRSRSEAKQEAAGACQSGTAGLKVRDAAAPSSLDFTRVAWIRRRYHLDHPTALLEDALLRYGRFVDEAVLSTSVARLASVKEAILVSELEGSPEKTVLHLVLRENNYFAALLRLQALLVDPTSQCAQTHHLLQSLICREDPADTASGAATSLRSMGGGGVSSLADPGAVPLRTVFYGNTPVASLPGGAEDAAASLPLPLPALRDPAALPRTIASLFERFSTLFLRCYPCRFLQDGLLALLYQRQDVPLPSRRLLPALLTYSLGSNESVLEATGSPSMVLELLSVARRAQRQQRRPTACIADPEVDSEESGEGRTDARGETKAVPQSASCKQGRCAALQQEVGSEHEGSKNDESRRGEAGSSKETEVLPASVPMIHSPASGHAVDSPLLPSSSLDISPQDTRIYDENIESPKDYAGPLFGQPLRQRQEQQQQRRQPLVARDHLMECNRIALSGSSSDKGDRDRAMVLPEERPPSAPRPHTLQDNPSAGTAAFSSPRWKGQTPGRLVEDVVREAAVGCTGDREAGGGESGMSLPLMHPRHRCSSAESASVALLPVPASPSAVNREGCNSICSRDDSSSSSNHREAAHLPFNDLHEASLSTAAVAAAYSAPETAETDSREGLCMEEVEEDAELFSDTESDDSGPLMELSGVGAGGDSSFSTAADERLSARMRRAQQRRYAAALQLRHALNPALTAAVVATAAVNARDVRASKENAKCRESGGSGDLQPVPQHAVLEYLEELVVYRGTQANCFDDADISVSVTYANVLARDGGEGALPKLAEQVALQHVYKMDAWGLSSSPLSAASASEFLLAASTSSYCLLHLLRLCATHRRWAGCAWMYYALGYYREAVELSLKYVVGEEGVRLAVRLLQLLQERDCRHDEAVRRRQLFSGALHSAMPAAATVHGSDTGCDYTQRQDVRRSRRELWMLVARHLIHGGGDTKHGAQTALQLSLRNGGDNFNVTDVLPELPDTLFMAELKEELLSSVRGLSFKMRGLRANTNALGRDTRILQRELQVMSNQRLTMQVDERCVLCGQPALARPFTVYPRCRHLLHVSCGHQARQAILRREGPRTAQPREASRASSLLSPRHMRMPSVRAASVRNQTDDGASNANRPLHPLQERTTAGEGSLSGPSRTHDHLGRSCIDEPRVGSMECLQCARRYLRTMLDTPLHVALVGDDVQQSAHRVALR
ncbi:hypothetical protein ABL78_5548 [Leptomonas seymouri]|uniref:Uncharacterized protein n=1 Tax=Leptomonas seymouri TaxID=5684 RepID=A0A0N1IJR8_LEPSE|nr:hypothetical protein ABL78_5548 [Leptomonas seymouri]|eukprot:KPI85400.1 hypothetical protein ABL78_5548 [Leptomonas seymouri]